MSRSYSLVEPLVAFEAPRGSARAARRRVVNTSPSGAAAAARSGMTPSASSASSAAPRLVASRLRRPVDRRGRARRPASASTRASGRSAPPEATTHVIGRGVRRQQLVDSASRSATASSAACSDLQRRSCPSDKPVIAARRSPAPARRPLAGQERQHGEAVAVGCPLGERLLDLAAVGQAQHLAAPRVHVAALGGRAAHQRPPPVHAIAPEPARAASPRSIGHERRRPRCRR